MKTWWPRRTRPAAKRSANRAAPFTSGAKVSHPIRMRKGVARSVAVTGGKRPLVWGAPCLSDDAYSMPCATEPSAERRALLDDRDLHHRVFFHKSQTLWSFPSGASTLYCVPKIHSAAAAEIGRRVRAVRQELGVSLEDLGELSEINWTTIGKIERGVSSPTVESLVRIATALEIDPGAFLSGVTADDYGARGHRLTAREFIRERARQRRD